MYKHYICILSCLSDFGNVAVQNNNFYRRFSISQAISQITCYSVE